MDTTTLSTTTVEMAVTDDGHRVPLLVHRPARPRGWLVWAHGGSWQRGSATDWAPVTAALADRSGWAVVSVEYRLAPEHRIPAAILDVLAGLDWTEHHAAELPVVVGGDSAGGTIAAAIALHRRNTGSRVPAQLLAYPPLDPDCTRPSYLESVGFPDAAELRTAWRLWLGTAPSDTEISPTPLLADDLTGLAPACLVVGDADPVRDDIIAYADRLRACGVPTTLRLLPGVGHADLLRSGGWVLPALVTALDTLVPPRTTTPRNRSTQRKNSS